MADSDDDSDSRFDDVDLESILARVERRGPLTFTRKRCLYRAPEFVRKLAHEETVNEGETVKFDCKVFAFPKASVKWYKDNEEIKDVPNIKTESLENGEFSITIEDIKKTDEGAYKCKVENPEGSSSSTIYVAVKAKKSPKKKNPACAVTFPSPFPPITENVEAEEREAKEVATQAESPLTHLYNGVKWKNRTWPDFLGGWECVNGFDLKDFGEMEDDEDVFLPEDSNNNDQIDKLKSTPKVEPQSNLFITNGVEEIMSNHVTIPNLVFENKNLLKTDTNKNSVCRTSFICSDTKQDENCNLGTQNSEQSSAVRETNQQTDQVKSVNTGNDISQSALGNGIKISPCSRKLNTQNLHLSNEVDRLSERQEINRENGDAGSYYGLECLFLISGFALVALYVDMAPDMFVFSVFIGQLLYCIIRFLLKES